MTSGQPTAEDVAQWMVDQVRAGKPIYQDQIAWQIQKTFGKQFIYSNANGNPAIGKDVLAAFRKRTDDDVVWSRSDRCWRLRKPKDKPGRQQY